MLIIFDLDDTLIETTRAILPFKLRHALEEMMRKGLEIADFNKSFDHLLCLNNEAESSRQGLELFLKEIQSLDFFNIGMQALDAPLPQDFTVSPTLYAQDVLLELKNHHTLALVTYGNLEYQKQKLKISGIKEEIFKQLIVIPIQNKKPSYEYLLQLLQYQPKETLVCGDRVASDLVPAKELGMHTVHMRCGRGKNNSSPKNAIDYTIENLSELKSIIFRITS